VNTQIEAIHLKAIAKVYSVLTPDQKAKFDQRFDRMMGVRQTTGV
jgi:Spy/CpxP family protein refolding chaperone